PPGPAPVPPTALPPRHLRREPHGTAGGSGTGSHAVRLTGRLDTGRLREALTGVLARHEALRCRITEPEDGGRPLLTVADEPCLRLTRTDLTHRTPAARRDAVRAQLAESAATPLSLESGRTSAFRLLTLGPDDHVLVLASHLGVFDGWSSGVFMNDLATGYREGPESLAPPELQLPDHADWQRRWLACPDGAAELAERRRAFAGIPPAPRAPAGFER
ncbi:condensation domain-containing protein, partial [Streptomyces sp. NPDC096153]|uniref:condensation domain-containing protein n=1 Tax=Streptomyces sp. NPDC096153 TaxID=3155548 RepID=UPI0033312620